MKTFTKWLEEKQLKLPSLEESGPEFGEFLDCLDSVIDKLNADWKNAGLQFEKIPGYMVNEGQQYNVKVSARLARQDRVFEENLFRAYIDPKGRYLSLDLYDGDYIRCQTPDRVFDEIRKFFGLDQVLMRLKVLARDAKRPG